MPTYQYKCQNCGYEFDKFQSMSARPLKSCPRCNGKVQRLISGGAGMIFKDSRSYAIEHHSKNSPACGRSKTCCGRETPCEKKPCE
jgi:putative FmdB family regulatory protein